MIIGIGVDIESIEKLRYYVESQGGRFLNEVFTTHEIQYAKNHQGNSNLATAFAGKEAFIKAVGGINRPDFCLKEVEILRKPTGQPYINLLEPLKTQCNDYVIHLSLSFTDNMAIANVVIEK